MGLEIILGHPTIFWNEDGNHTPEFTTEIWRIRIKIPTNPRHPDILKLRQCKWWTQTKTLGVQRPLIQWSFRKDHCFTRDLQSTIPGDYYFNGLWLTGKTYLDSRITFSGEYCWWNESYSTWDVSNPLQLVVGFLIIGFGSVQKINRGYTLTLLPVKQCY